MAAVPPLPAISVTALDAANDPSIVEIDYTNYRGERQKRRILPDRLWFGTAEWHPEPQWILDAWDLDKQALRSFALSGVHAWLPGGTRSDG